ncbi:carbohydrate ABC transporter permease [Castellaniella sp.]|uniref:carbohydrate ABC transporter permease n=1 Tax=Castellaniella sp. TaxID=1955812 RepID=UPI003C715D28
MSVLSLFFNLLEPVFRFFQRRLGLSRLGWLFVGPNLLLFGIFTFVPIAINFVYATTGGVKLLPFDRPFTGGENFQTLFQCGNYLDLSTCNRDIFWRAILNTLEFSVVQVVLMLVFSVLTAVVLNRKIIGRGFWRGVFFYPVLLSPVVVALLWKWMLQSQGVLNAGLAAADLAPINWLSDAGWAFSWTIFVSIWAHMGFYTLILLAGLQAIPRDIYEAAEMDHASPWRTLTRITLPLLMPNLVVVLVLAAIRAVQIFDEVFVLTGGGPGSATTFIVQFIYQTGFAEQIHLYGLAAAASLALAAFLVVLTLLQLRLSRSGGHAGGGD